MEEVIQSVANALSESPQLALWVLVIIYGYKVVIIGSAYGVIRFVVDRVHSAYTTPKHTLEKVDVEARLRSLTIPNCHDALVAQIERVAGRKSFGGNEQKRDGAAGYIHSSDVQWLREAIDDRIAKG